MATPARKARATRPARNAAPKTATRRKVGSHFCKYRIPDTVSVGGTSGNTPGFSFPPETRTQSPPGRSANWAKDLGHGRPHPQTCPHRAKRRIGVPWDSRMALELADPPASRAVRKTRRGRELVYRHSLLVRLTHWINVLCIALLLMSGMQIFNAHPMLHWGIKGADTDPSVLSVYAEEQLEGPPIGWV